MPIFHVSPFTARRRNHAKVAGWTDGDVELIRETTEQYFCELHDQRRDNNDSTFSCRFGKRDPVFGGKPTNTLAFVKIHGEDNVSKYNVKCHHFGPRGRSSGQEPDISEFLCYKLLALINVSPQPHIIPPRKITGTKTGTYIATKWDDNFEILEKVFIENRLNCLAQKSVYRQWKNTQNAAIVDSAPSSDYKVYGDIKSELLSTFPHKDWKPQY